jgi:site-specific recombinase XerD
MATAAHVLRHTFASHSMMNGANILTLRKVLGHSDIKMIMRYSHLSPDFLEEAIQLKPLSNIK